MNLDARAAARLLCTTEERIYDWVSKGAIPSYRVQEQLRFNRVELLEWASTHRMKVAPDLFGEERRGGNGHAVKLSRALASGGIHRGFQVGNEREALQALGALLPLPPGVDRETVTALFAAREGVTSVGGGVAIPHARAPAVLPVRAPIVALGFPAKPIDVHARDGQPVSSLFVVFSPTIRIHLDVLSKIAFALANPGFHLLLDRQAKDEEILDSLAGLEAAAGVPPAPSMESGSI